MTLSTNENRVNVPAQRPPRRSTMGHPPACAVPSGHVWLLLPDPGRCLRPWICHLSCDGFTLARWWQRLLCAGVGPSASWAPRVPQEQKRVLGTPSRRVLQSEPPRAVARGRVWPDAASPGTSGAAPRLPAAAGDARSSWGCPQLTARCRPWAQLPAGDRRQQLCAQQDSRAVPCSQRARWEVTAA